MILLATNTNANGWFQEKLNGIYEAMQEVARAAGEEGEVLVKEHVSTRGTAKSGKRGRIETGAMISSVSNEYRRENESSAEVKFGWISGFPSYTAHQELGFNHVNSGEYIEGMHTLADTRDQVRTMVAEELKVKLRNV